MMQMKSNDVHIRGVHALFFNNRRSQGAHDNIHKYLISTTGLCMTCCVSGVNNLHRRQCIQTAAIDKLKDELCFIRRDNSFRMFHSPLLMFPDLAQEYLVIMFG